MSGAAGERAPARLVTLAFVRHGDALLLLRHPPGSDRFPGLWNGIGGHVEPGEDIREAARRELREEAGLDVPDLRLRAVIHEHGLLGHAHVVFGFVGQSRTRSVDPAPGVELGWHPIAALGNLPLVGDLELLLPRMLAADEPVFATEVYDGGDGRLSLRIAADPGAPASAAGEVVRG